MHRLFTKLITRIRDVDRPALFLAAVLLSTLLIPLNLVANGGDDHSGSTPSAGNAGSVSTVTAERNIQNDSGQFTIVIKRSPGDPRVGETVQLLIAVSEKVEGGFGSGPLPIEKGDVSATMTQPNGSAIGETVALTEEPGGLYRGAYRLNQVGDFKILVKASTQDGRGVEADFPVTVARAPVQLGFWVGVFILIIMSGGVIAFSLYRLKKTRTVTIRSFAPVAVSVAAVFLLAVLLLVFLVPPTQTRDIAVISTAAFTDQNVNALPVGSIIKIPKESQLLFGIKTQLVDVRNVSSGLKTTGIVKVRPDANGVVTAQVPGRVAFAPSVALGAAVSRGQQIGSIEQVLDVSGQVDLESQRLEVEAQTREVEAKKLELRNTILSLQAQQAESSALAQQARTRLSQAQRELRRAQNLLEVGAAPLKRVEEARTAVKVIEEESAAADKQVGLLGDQIKAAQAGQSIFRAVAVRQPSRNFPLIAPVTGIVDKINATAGQQVSSGAELVSLVNLSTVLLEAQVFEKDLPSIRESTRASFTSSTLLGEVYTIGTADGEGRLVSIGQTVDAQSRTIPVIYEVKNPFGRLRDGNFIEIMIDISGGRSVLAVPKSAVVREQGESFVYVFDGGETFERRPVVLGAEGTEFFEVVSGLKEGERVVVEGVYQLRTTQPSE